MKQNNFIIAFAFAFITPFFLLTQQTNAADVKPILFVVSQVGRNTSLAKISWPTYLQNGHWTTPEHTPTSILGKTINTPLAFIAQSHPNETLSGALTISNKHGYSLFYFEHYPDFKKDLHSFSTVASDNNMNTSAGDVPDIYFHCESISVDLPEYTYMTIGCHDEIRTECKQITYGI